MDALQYGALGLVATVLAAIGWFFVRHLWPFFKKQIEQRQQDLERAAQHCEDRLNKIANEAAAAVTAQAQATERIVEEFQRTIRDIRGARK